MATLIRHLALISETQSVSTADLMVVAAALQKQATRDLAPIWDVAATVDAFDRLEDVPLDYWPLILMDDIDQDGASGVHLDRNGQPYALITASENRDIWSVTASHEGCEMLVDPFGSRLVAGQSMKPDQNRVNYLVEVCDPSENADFAYPVNGVPVSDFYTPHFFDPVKAPSVRYSYTGALDGPRMTREGGYVSWMDLATGIWWQQVRDLSGNARFRELGRLDGSQSLRSQIDRITAAETAAAVSSGGQERMLAGLRMQGGGGTFEARAAALREDIANLAS